MLSSRSAGTGNGFFVKWGELNSVIKAKATVAIGSGSFGTVYLAVVPSLGRSPVAIKVMNPHLSSRETEEDFTREVEAMAHIPAHENCLRILGACVEKGHLAVITEHCALGDVRDLIKKPRAPIRWTWDDVLHIAIDTAKGMRHLHAHKVVHRDLKSRNLLVSPTQSGFIVKVADFGLAVASRRSERGTAIHATSVGTSGWMAPEVIEEDEYTYKCDQVFYRIFFLSFFLFFFFLFFF
jgi:serine/threonine protein kinase